MAQSHMYAQSRPQAQAPPQAQTLKRTAEPLTYQQPAPANRAAAAATAPPSQPRAVAQAPPAAAAARLPATEIPGNNGRPDFPGKIELPPKSATNPYSNATSASLPGQEMYDIATSLSVKEDKHIVMDYWAESLRRDNTIMITEVKAADGKRYHILMKSEYEFTTPIKQWYEIIYKVPMVKDGKQEMVSSCGYLFVTQNSIYFVKYPLRMGTMTVAEFEKRNRLLDQQQQSQQA